MDADQQWLLPVQLCHRQIYPRLLFLRCIISGKYMSAINIAMPSSSSSPPPEQGDHLGSSSVEVLRLKRRLAVLQQEVDKAAGCHVKKPA